MSVVLSHYPRPRMKRESWHNLNGIWQFELNASETQLQSMDHAIFVPFCVESQDSGLGWSVKPHHYMHYRRFFSCQKKENERVYLHFGAVDQVVDVFVNKHHVCHHIGGYASFSIDITEIVRIDDNEIYCIVNDKTEKSPLVRGKQRANNKGSMRNIFYTPTSGIWKTVWLEIVPETHIQDVSIQGDLDARQVTINVCTKKNDLANIKVSFQGRMLFEKSIETNREQVFSLEEIHPWSPEQPNLYDVELSLGQDKIVSYFALRKIALTEDTSGLMRFALNNEPYFMNGVLDQGYWPTSLLTPPNDTALALDIAKMKEAGFNTLRKHVKVEEEHFYYLCDTLGMLVVQDMPNGGGDYNFNFVTYLPNMSDFLSRHISDHHYGLLKRKDPWGREMFYVELESMIRQLNHYSCIVTWVPFNEGWGQFDAGKATRFIKEIDPTRLVNEACGWFDQGGGDIMTYHSYFKKLKVRPNHRAVALTEYGGQALAIEGHTFSDQKFGYKKLDKETANDALEKLVKSKVVDNIACGLSSSIYTQLSDVESEVNGLMTYDREVFKFDLERIQKLNKLILKTFKEVI